MGLIFAANCCTEGEGLSPAEIVAGIENDHV